MLMNYLFVIIVVEKFVMIVFVIVVVEKFVMIVFVIVVVETLAVIVCGTAKENENESNS
jgi:hypothetical protein